MSVAVLCGNPNPRSRTLTVAEAVAGRIADALGAPIGPVIDLHDRGAALAARAG
ncbi:MAG TPA: hypothetical protein VFG42_19530 [Baekduia sp.]|uniref:hypothetical protein n=1 Tax=Baekduia sp. TaxID=2600305 RepID=UPI002D76F292|nr:hypothetical protein [Baekduia sp.]HET6508994.1 hypothetical protein [Baekduia sp.]